MFNFTSDIFFEYYNEYIFSLILFNILIYIFLLINIFLIFFIFDMKYIKTLNELKFFGNLPLVSVFLVFLLLSFAGIPPLTGFISKFLIFIYVFSKQNIFYFLFFIFVNLFIIYFYIQNLRFLISKNVSNKFIIKNNNIILNSNIFFFFNFFNFFNLLGLFYFEEIFIYLNFISSNIYF
jgi:NADH:ubiquinone oxidoreductase subunit 2 (subunit N)